MSEEQNKFDQLIQDKFSAKDFPFDEENWEKVEEQMDSDKKRKRFMWISLVFLIGLTAGVGVMLPFINSGTQPETKMIVQVEQKPELNEAPLKEEKKVADKTTVPIKVLAENEMTVHHPSDGKNKENIFNKEQSTPTISSPKKTKVVKQNLISSADHSFATNKKNVSDDPTTKKYTKNIEPVPFADVNDADNKKSYGIVKLDNVNTDSIESKRITDLVNSGIVPAEDSAPRITQVEPKDSVQSRKDSIIADAISNAPMVESAPQKLASTNIYSIDAGVHYGFGWNYSDTTVEGRGFDPIIGFGFTHYFNTKWSFATGIQYGAVAHLNSQKTITNIIGDFGLTRTDTIINTRWMHYAVVPVFANYILNDKNSIGLGGSIGYLVNTTSDYITIYQSDFKQTVQTKVRSLGYTEGFNRINATCGIAYRRRITDKIFITTEAHYGLLDIKNDNFFSKQKVERTSGIKFTISYSILNHK